MNKVLSDEELKWGPKWQVVRQLGLSKNGVYIHHKIPILTGTIMTTIIQFFGKPAGMPWFAGGSCVLFFFLMVSFSSLLRTGSYTMPCNSRSSMTRSLSPWWNHRKPCYFYDLSRELKPFLIIRAGGEGQMDKCWALSYQIFFFSVLYNSARIQGGQIHRNANRQKWQGWGLKLCLDFISTYGSFNASGIYSGRVQRLLPITSTTLVRLEICVISWKQKDPWYPGWSV